MTRAEQMRQREIEYRLDEIEQLEDCGINRSDKVEREYKRLMAEWKELDKKDRESQ